MLRFRQAPGLRTQSFPSRTKVRSILLSKLIRMLPLGRLGSAEQPTGLFQSLRNLRAGHPGGSEPYIAKT